MAYINIVISSDFGNHGFFVDLLMI